MQLCAECIQYVKVIVTFNGEKVQISAPLRENFIIHTCWSLLNGGHYDRWRNLHSSGFNKFFYTN